jgi:quercetin dioxygenase-like cupin family protein
MRAVSYLRDGRLVPKRQGGLRAGSVRLAPGGLMPWHSTGDREELILVLAGRIEVHAKRAGRRRTSAVPKGRCLFLPSRTEHAVLNRSRRPARYVYVTAAA